MFFFHHYEVLIKSGYRFTVIGSQSETSNPTVCVQTAKDVNLEKRTDGTDGSSRKDAFQEYLSCPFFFSPWKLEIRVFMLSSRWFLPPTTSNTMNSEQGFYSFSLNLPSRPTYSPVPIRASDGSHPPAWEPARGEQQNVLFHVNP